MDEAISTNKNIKRNQIRTKSKVINITGKKREKTAVIKSHAISFIFVFDWLRLVLQQTLRNFELPITTLNWKR